MPGNAAIYISDPSLIGSKFFDKLYGVRSCQSLSENGSAIGVQFVLDAAQVAMNFLPGYELEDHLKGFSGFARNVIEDEDELIYVLSRIHYVRMVLGCIINPGFDTAGKTKAFLFQFNEAANGLLFTSDTIFDYDGVKLGGL